MMSEEQFKKFWTNGFDKKFVKDWLVLARSDSVSVTKDKKNNTENTEYLRFNAFYIILSYLANSYIFTLDGKVPESSVDETVLKFVTDLCSEENKLYLSDYIPFATKKLDKLLYNFDIKKKCEAPSDLFANIGIVHKHLFQNADGIHIDEELLSECNFLLNDFFNRLQKVLMQDS